MRKKPKGASAPPLHLPEDALGDANHLSFYAVSLFSNKATFLAFVGAEKFSEFYITLHYDGLLVKIIVIIGLIVIIIALLFPLAINVKPIFSSRGSPSAFSASILFHLRAHI